MKNTIKIVLLAAFLTTAVAFLNAQANSQEKAQEEPRKEVAQGPRGLQETVTDKLRDIPSEAAKDKYQTWAAIVALIGALVSLLPKTFESVSLVSRRRRDLQRIEDLASLIQKIRAENVLSETTLEHVKIQIEAEIMLAVNALEKGRRRLIEKNTQRDDLDLGLQGRLFLLYRPVGIRAWIAHFCAYAAAILGLSVGYVLGIRDSHFDLKTFFAGYGWLIFLFYLVIAWLFGMWALWERKRWRKTHPSPLPTDLDLSFQRRLFLLYRPVGIRAWIAHFCAYAMAILGFAAGVSTGDFGLFVSIFLFYLVIAWLFGMWALWERKRWRETHPTPLPVASGSR